MQSILARSHQDSSPHSIYQIDNEIISSSNPETFPLAAGINNVTNSTEKNITHRTYLPDGEDANTKHTGWLKRLCVGVAILTGTGALAAGCYYGFSAGRPSSSDRSSQETLPLLAKNPVITEAFPQRINTSILSPYTNDLEAVTSTPVPEISISPYSYYEGIYGNTMARNKVLKAIPVTTVEKNDGVTEAISSSDHGTTTTTVKSIHENERHIYYDTVPKDIYYPLGRKLYNELAAFCNSDIQTIVFDSYNADPFAKCKLLGSIADKIDEYKFYDSTLRQAHSFKETLSADDHAEEIMARRKLTTLYLAAESIIDNKDAGEFYRDAMADYKDYTSAELAQREENIMNYFPVHDAMGEC